MSKTPDYLKEGAGFIDVTLKSPAKTSAGEVSMIRVREPTAGDLVNFQEATGSDAKKEIDQFAHLCELTPEDIRGLTLRNYVRLQEAFKLFTQ